MKGEKETHNESSQPAEHSADDIRAAAHRYVIQAREEGQDCLSIVAGDIVRELRMPYRVPSVVSALGSKRFQKENGITLENREGPPSGISTTTKFTYRINRAVEPEKAAPSSLWSLRGAGKETLKAFGGGEAFLTAERDKLHLP